jgi:thiamine kinase-like enzyme
LISSIEQITKTWLASALKIEAAQIAELQIEMFGQDLHSSKWRLGLTYTQNTQSLPTCLFLKSSQRNHEARFYQASQLIADKLPIVPCYDLAIEGEASHILLKDLSQTHESRLPSQLPPLAHDCEAIIDTLADLHAYWWDHPQLSLHFGERRSTDELTANFAEDSLIFREMTDFLADRLSVKRREIFEIIAAKLPDVIIKRYQGKNFTLTFEDVHLGNFLYPKQADEKLYLIDWEQWGLRLAMNDLSYMMAVFWSPERRSRLEIPYLQRYLQRIQGKGILYSWDELWYDYRLSILWHLFIPAWQWKHAGTGFADVWWNHLERIYSSIEGLNCLELL